MMAEPDMSEKGRENYKLEASPDRIIRTAIFPKAFIAKHTLVIHLLFTTIKQQACE